MNIIKLLGIFWTFIIIVILSIFIQGFVLRSLWQWFAVPFGLPAISIFHALGLILLVDYLTHHYYDYKKTDEAGMITAISYLVFRPIIVYTFGFIFHFFV